MRLAIRIQSLVGLLAFAIWVVLWATTPVTSTDSHIAGAAFTAVDITLTPLGGILFLVTLIMVASLGIVSFGQAISQRQGGWIAAFFLLPPIGFIAPLVGLVLITLHSIRINHSYPYQPPSYPYQPPSYIRDDLYFVLGIAMQFMPVVFYVATLAYSLRASQHPVSAPERITVAPPTP
jgi:hypothetical protein